MNKININVPAKLGWASLAVLFGLLPLVVMAATAPTFNDPGFASTWNRVDKPLLDLAGGAGRGYTWGPALPQAAQVSHESYNGGQRTVQYFDKARMEVNNPGGNPQDLFYVTTGLLVKELVTGKRQDGDNTFSQYPSSDVQVAGDTNEAGGNRVAPTYANFRFLGTFHGTENGQPAAQGQPVTQRIDHDGKLTTISPPESRLVTGYDPVTQHNIPDVFVAFANAEGPIWNGSNNVTGQILFGNPVYVLGRPLTEAYWTRAVVRGVEQDVMVQLFERRVLTYTPANAEGFKVEMGNVGQHYYRWRYATPQPALEKVWEIGKDFNGMQEPQQVVVDPQGNSFVLTRNVKGIQKYDAAGKFIKSWGETSDFPDMLVVDGQGELYRSHQPSHLVEKYDNDGNLLFTLGIQGRGQGQFERVSGLAVDPQDNLYVLEGSNNVVHKYDSQGKYLSRVDLTGGLANFSGTIGGVMAVDGQGHLFVLGSYYYSKNYLKGAVFKFDNQGRLLARWDDPEVSPRSLALDGQGYLYVISGPQVIKMDNNLKGLASWGKEGTGDGEFQVTTSVAVDRQGNVYVSDWDLNRVQKFDNQGKFLAKFGSYGQAPGQLRHPEGVTSDDRGNIYVADANNARVQKFNSSGQFLMQFGSYGAGNGQFKYPAGIGVDSGGNIYVTDVVGESVQKFDPTGKFLFKVSNNPEHPLATPYKMAIDGQDNVYILTGSEPRIIKLNSKGEILARFGSTGKNQDQLYAPQAIATDRIPGQAGKVYVLDIIDTEHLTLIRQFDSEGQPVFKWGNDPNVRGVNALGAQAFTVDRSGNVYTIDNQGRIKKFNSSADQVAEWGPETYTPDLRPDTRWLAVDNQDNLLAPDFFNDRLIKLRQV
jgi:sugar lactone lactonase YvrE